MTITLKITIDPSEQNTILLPCNEGVSYAGYSGLVIFKESRTAPAVLLTLTQESGLTLDENGATISIDAATAQELASAGAAYYCFDASGAGGHQIRIEAPVEFV